MLPITLQMSHVEVIWLLNWPSNESLLCWGGVDARNGQKRRFLLNPPLLENFWVKNFSRVPQCSVSHGHGPNLGGGAGSKVPLMILYRVRCPWCQKTLVMRCPWSFCTRYGAPENIWLQFLPKICSMGPILLFMTVSGSEFGALSIQTL